MEIRTSRRHVYCNLWTPVAGGWSWTEDSNSRGNQLGTGVIASQQPGCRLNIGSHEFLIGCGML